MSDKSSTMTESMSSPSTMGLDDARRVELYQYMLRLRLVDSRMLNLQRQGRIGFYGTATGQEASVIGTAAAGEDGDWFFPRCAKPGSACCSAIPSSR